MTDHRANRIAGRVAIHLAVDGIVDARRQMGGDGPAETTAEALSDALDHLSAVALGEDLTEPAWQAVAAIAQGQLEAAMEARAR